MGINYVKPTAVFMKRKGRIKGKTNESLWDVVPSLSKKYNL